MWGFEKEKPVPEEETAEHQTPEDRIQAGEQFATFEDLEGLNDLTLYAIAEDCPVEPSDPDICVPCRAFQMLVDRESEKNSQPSSAEPMADPPVEEVSDEAVPVPSAEEPSGTTTPVIERFQAQVHALHDLVTELLEGPPIPPPNVSLEELAVLTVAAQKWLQMVDAQGLTLSPDQEAMRAFARATVERLKR